MTTPEKPQQPTYHRDGGPAFPVPGLNLEGLGFIHPEFGMSLLDYIAIQAMSAMISGHFAHHGHESYWPRDEIASEAYAVARAMIQEREK